MATATFTCPRCFRAFPSRGIGKFCPHCGLSDAQAAAADTEPVSISIGKRIYSVQARMAVGSVCSIYRCQISEGPRDVDGVFKIARDPCANHLVANEARLLRQLNAGDPTGKFTPFLPAVDESFGVGDSPTTPARQANVLRLHPDIKSPDDLYTLGEVRRQYPAGLDGRDVAWMWRRLLSILGFAHTQGIVHCAVLPMHVLIEPKQHALLLIDWCAAMPETNDPAQTPGIIAGGYQLWYKAESSVARPPRPALDIAFAARCMLELLGGDGVAGTAPATVEPALVRHLQRCLGTGPTARPDAWRLQEDFDRLMTVLWGPRKFRVLTMPARKPS